MNKYKIEIKWAIIFTVMMLLWMLMEKLAGFHDKNIEQHAIVTNLVFFPAVTAYVLALLDKRKNYYNGTMSYKQSFMSGLIMTAFITLLAPLSQYLTSAVISPDYFKNMIDYTVSSGTLSREAAEAQFNMQSYLIISVIFTPIVGIITTAIVSIFVKKA